MRAPAAQREHAGRRWATRLAVAATVGVLAVATAAAPAAGRGPAGPPGAAVAAGSAGGPPVATIGELDCERLEVGVVLDNSRSAAPAAFRYGSTFVSPLRRPYTGDDGTRRVVVGAAGTTRVVLPVRDDARTVVTVRLPDGGIIHSTGSCGSAPAAVFGPVRCDPAVVGLTLDNRGVRADTRYRWTLADSAGALRSAVVQVRAGERAGVEVPLPAGSRARVSVAVDGGGPVATSDWRSCGSFTLDPRVGVGALDCRDLAVTFVLDNSRSTSRVRLRLPAHGDVVLGPGATRTLALHLPLADRLAATADGVPADGWSSDLAVVSTTRCARAAAVPAPGPATGATALAAGPGGASGPAAEEGTTSGPSVRVSPAGAAALAAGLAAGAFLLLWARRRWRAG